MGEKPPAAPVIHVSREWITVRAKRVASAEVAIADEDLIIDGLYVGLVLLADELGISFPHLEIHTTDSGRSIPNYGPDDDLIIQVDRDVEFELLSRVLYTCGRAAYGRLNLAAINPASRELEVFSLELPRGSYTEPTPATAEPEAEPEPEPEPALFVEGTSFKLSYRDASGEHVYSTIERDYSVLTDELKQMKRRRPGHKNLVIVCTGDVEYKEFVRVLEVIVEPEIALTEISLCRNPMEDTGQ
jgi:biopolymer transport protein ExbD